MNRDDSPASLPLAKQRSKAQRRRLERAERTERTAQESVEDFLARQGVSADWDFLIFSDGSGSRWEHACGWGAVTVRRSTMKKMLWAGFGNYGTVNFAEIMGVLHPLTFLESEAERIRDEGGRAFQKIIVFTDSQYVRDVGSGDAAGLKKNIGVWAMLQALKRKGLIVEWRWIAAGDSRWNTLADNISKLAREHGQAYNPLGAVR